MGKTVFEVDGVEQLRKRLSSFGKIAMQSGIDGLNETADLICEGAKQRAPIKSGNLIDTIHTAPDMHEGNHYSVDIVAGPVIHNGVDYSINMHEGWGGHVPYNLGELSASMSAGPAHVGTGKGWKFLQRAFESEYRKALGRINKIMQAKTAGLTGGAK